MDIFSSLNIVPAWNPVDLGAGANDGDWVSLKNYGRVACVLQKAIGTAGQDPTITIEQAQNVTGTGAKALNFTKVLTKRAVDIFAVGAWTKVTKTDNNTYSSDTLAEEAAVIAIEFDAADLDVNNGFDCIRMRVADPGAAAQLGGAFYLLSEPRVGPNESAIVN